MSYDELYKNTLKNIYSTPKFKQYQEEFEVRLGNYAYTHHKSFSAINEGLDKLKNTLYVRYKKDTIDTPECTDENSNNTPAYTDDTQETLSFYSNIDENSDLRKKVTDFYNAAYSYNSPTKYEYSNIARPGTTAQILNTCKYIGMNSQEKLLNFRLALIGCFLPERKQSLHDMLAESHSVGVKGKEDLTDFSTMDECVSPLEKEEIIDNCGESLLGNLNRQLGNLTDQQIRAKFNGQIPFENFSDKLLPLEEYICSRFIASSRNEPKKQDDDTNLSLLAKEDNLSSLYDDLTDNSGILSLPSLERLSAYSYGGDKYTLMNRKLFLGPSKFKLDLETTLKNNFYNHLLYRLTDVRDGNQIVKSIVGTQSSAKIHDSLKKNSKFSSIFSPIAEKDSCIKYINNEVAKFAAGIPHIAFNYWFSYTKESSEEEYLKKAIDSFCESTANEIVNKYITQRLFDDIDILNFGLAKYFKNSPKYTGEVYSGRFITENDNFKEGQTYILPSQISTSKNAPLAEFFVKEKTETTNPSFWIIQLKGYNAVDFSSVSPHTDEEEVLIPAGTKFKVDKVVVKDLIRDEETIKNVTYVYLTELEH